MVLKSLPPTHEKVGERILDYWRNLMVFGETEARKKAKTITPSLFRTLVKPQDACPEKTANFSEPDYQQEILTQIEPHLIPRP